jgi:hypothetical protein
VSTNNGVFVSLSFYLLSACSIFLPEGVMVEFTILHGVLSHQKNKIWMVEFRVPEKERKVLRIA